MKIKCEFTILQLQTLLEGVVFMRDLDEVSIPFPDASWYLKDAEEALVKFILSSSAEELELDHLELVALEWSTALLEDFEEREFPEGSRQIVTTTILKLRDILRGPLKVTQIRSCFDAKYISCAYLLNPWTNRLQFCNEKVVSFNEIPWC